VRRCRRRNLLVEAQDVGWQALGGDIEPAAVRIAGRNAPEARLLVADARALPLRDGVVAACVSNLPFGRQYGVEGPMKPWLRTVTAELARVTQPGGRVVLLTPERLADPAPGLRLLRQVPIRLLGTRTTIWELEWLGASGRRPARSGRRTAG
jgi:tRNA G10  N-methylase Trm11